MFVPLRLRPIRTSTPPPLKSCSTLAANTSDGDRLEVLTTLVEAYERRHHAIGHPEPVEALRYYMEMFAG